MKVVLLVGGKGARLNTLLPKPLVKIGGISLIEHIMNLYYFFGYDEFILATGHRHDEFEKHFYSTDLPYSVKLINTGENTNTGERIKRIEPYVKDEIFCLNYGDGLSDVNLKDIEEKFCLDKTCPDLLLVAVRSPERYGFVDLEKTLNRTSKILSFYEKPKRIDWINGGFMVCSPRIFRYIEKDDIFEQNTIPRIIKKQKALAYKYKGNWISIDTQKDLNAVTNLWDKNKAFWINNKDNNE